MEEHFAGISTLTEAVSGRGFSASIRPNIIACFRGKEPVQLSVYQM
jgi:hypothetical protein